MNTLLHTDHIEVALLEQGKEVQELLILFQHVAEELTWQPGEFLCSASPSSAHLAGFVGGQLAGGIQIVIQNEEGHLPCQRVWQELEFTKEECLGHVTIMALAPEFRGCPGLFWSLCVELWRYCVAHRIEGIVLETTPRMFHLYRRIGWPLQVIGELRRHWGEDCYLCKMQTIEVAGSLLVKALRSQWYQELVCQACRRV